jgi:hypothetical protein
VDRDTPERQHGLSEGAPSRNGNRLDQDRFYGFMENVSHPTSTLSRGLTVFSSDSGCGKECSMVCQFFNISVLKTNGVG